MATASWIKNELEERKVAFEELHHREVFTTQEVAQSEHVSGHRVAKVVIAMADGHPVELVLPASRRVVLEQVRQLMGAKQVRLASEAEMDRIFVDVDTGAIPPLRHWEGVEVIMDETMRVDGPIVIQGGTHRDTIQLDFNDWFEMVKPRVGAFSELDQPAAHRSFADREDMGMGA